MLFIHPQCCSPVTPATNIVYIYMRTLIEIDEYTAPRRNLTQLGHNKLIRDCFFFNKADRGHGGRVVTLSPPTSEARVRFPARPQVGKLVVACRWSAVYSTDP